MDLNLNNSLNVNRVLNPTPVAPEEIGRNQTTKLKKANMNPGLDGLSNLLANPAKLSAPPENMSVEEAKNYKELKGIDAALNDIDARLEEIKSMAQDEMSQREKILTLLKGLEEKLNQIGAELDKLATACKTNEQDSKSQQAQMSQVNQLRSQIDAQREQQRMNDELTNKQKSPEIV